MADFSIPRQSSDSGCTVFGLVGELDLSSASRMRAAGLAALAAPGCSMLVLDVTALTLVDSSGIGSLVGLHFHAHQREQRLVLRGVSENLTRVLTIAGLTSVFDIEPVGGNQA